MAFYPEHPFSSDILPLACEGCPRKRRARERTSVSYARTTEAEAIEAWFEASAARHAAVPHEVEVPLPEDCLDLEANEAMPEANRVYGAGATSLCALYIGRGICPTLCVDPVTRTIEERNIDCSISEA
jgi:hypothetical protein